MAKIYNQIEILSFFEVGLYFVGFIDLDSNIRYRETFIHIL